MNAIVMDSPYRPAALDRGGQGVLGRPLDRYEGIAKVTGGARYSYEGDPDAALHGWVIGATIGRGRVVAIDAAAARAMPGVVAIITDHPQLPSGGSGAREPSLRGPTDRIDHWGQPLGVVVADCAEAARAAARAVTVRYEAEDGRFDTEAALVEHDHGIGFLPPIDIGDVEAALGAAPVLLDASYTTPMHFPAAMEPHATTAWWDGDRLVVRSSLQILAASRETIAASLGIDEGQVQVLAPYVGGGFGGKTGVGPEVVIAAIASRELGRPVKIALPRRQTAYLVHHRSETRQRIRIGCDADGRILAIAQESIVSQKDDKSFLEPVPFGSIPLYAGAARRFTTALARVDLPATGAVRAPGEAVGTLALETAMDELADRLGLDPIELRRRNEPDKDPTSGKPFATRRMLDCYDAGASAFGWDRRDPTPGGRREGEWLVGMGMAAAFRGNFTVEGKADVTLGADGRATVSCDMTDIGTGTYTILAQTAGEMLGLPIDRVDIVIGDSNLPRSPGSGGSFGAGAACSATALACEDILAELARRMNAAPDELTLKDGCVRAGGREVALVDLVRGEAITGHGHMKPGKAAKDFSQASHGAHFAEVAVNAVTGEVRVRRMLGVFDVGRVLNAKTARNQIVGGMVWGIAYALSEDARVDPRFGHFVNPDFGEYHVAVSADVPQIECHFIEEIDDLANPIGAKAVGELGISGAGAAVANAVHNACGVRVREFPITVDKLLAGLPPV